MITSQNHQADRSKRWRFLIGGAIIVAAVAYIAFSSAQDTALYALTIHELQAQPPSIYGQAVRVGGTVDGRSILWDADDQILTFNLVDGAEVLAVTYQGVRPDMFRDGAQALVEGQYQSNGVFEAARLLLQCPSKYEASSERGERQPK